MKRGTVTNNTIKVKNTIKEVVAGGSSDHQGTMSTNSNKEGIFNESTTYITSKDTLIEGKRVLTITLDSRGNKILYERGVEWSKGVS